MTFCDLVGEGHVECSPVEGPSLEMQAVAAVKILSEQTSHHNWQLLSSWLTQVLSCRLPCGTHSAHMDLDNLMLQDLPAAVSRTLEGMFSHPLCQQVLEGLNKLALSDTGKFILLCLL